MKVGIGLPAAIPGVSGERILQWARGADAGPFSSLAVIDRLVYPNYEPMVALAAAAGVTRRVRLVTAVLLAPLRNTAVLAKEAASLDAISGGRLTFGLGIGRRPDDFLGAGVHLKGRGKRFDEQLALMRRIWSGERLTERVGPVGPPPGRRGGPEVLLGGRAPEALARVGRWADGYLGPPVDPAVLGGLLTEVDRSWNEHGRPGKPRHLALEYFALGQDAAGQASASMRSYYGFQPDGGASAVGRVLSTPQAVKAAIAAKESVGVDELLLLPAAADLVQIERLAEVIG